MIVQQHGPPFHCRRANEWQGRKDYTTLGTSNNSHGVKISMDIQTNEVKKHIDFERPIFVRILIVVS